MTDALDTFARAHGVTRLARLTGLDRTGVEVVGAVRPFGHVLQVCQGKGWTLEAARRSALGEALELEAAEAPATERLHFGPTPPNAVADAHGLSVAWVEGRALGDGRRRVSVPAQSVYCPPAGTCWLGPAVTRWQSNGLASHPTSLARATEHAVLELLERDALARVLPRGWTVAAARRTLVASPPRVAAVEAQGFAAFVFDLSPKGQPLSVAGALLFELEGGPVPLTAGYACRRTWAEAADAAFLEAAQSRLTEIHGAREDVLTGDRDGAEAFFAALRRLRPRAAPRRRYQGPLAAVSPAPIAIVQLSARPFVVKAVAPGLLVSELL